MAKLADEQEQYRVVEAKFTRGMTKPQDEPESELPEVAFAGRSNVGKSSMLNTLLGRRSLVRTSSTPGCTRQLNVFEARLAGGLAVNFVDLPGFGYAKRSKNERTSWGEVIEYYLRERRSLRLVVLLVDVRRGLEEEEQMLLDFVNATRDGQLPVVVVATKLDKVAPAAGRSSVERLGKQIGGKAIGFSAKTASGRVQVWRTIEFVVGAGVPAG